MELHRPQEVKLKPRYLTGGGVWARAVIQLAIRRKVLEESLLRLIQVPYDSGDVSRRKTAGRLGLVGASLTAYDPDRDVGQKGLNEGLNLIELFAQLSTRVRRDF